MNLIPEQPDPHDEPIDGSADTVIDEELLNAALAEPAPAGLDAKILELTDPHMLSLLDEALAPEPMDDGLTQRILAAINDPMPSERPAVLARISRVTMRYTVAAVLTLGICFGAWLWVSLGGQEHEQVATRPAIANDGTPSLVEDTPSLSAADVPEALIRDLAMGNNFFEDTASALPNPLTTTPSETPQETISHDTFWLELDAYEQFLSDMEADEV